MVLSNDTGVRRVMIKCFLTSSQVQLAGFKMATKTVEHRSRCYPLTDRKEVHDGKPEGSDYGFLCLVAARQKDKTSL